MPSRVHPLPVRPTRPGRRWLLALLLHGLVLTALGCGHLPHTAPAPAVPAARTVHGGPPATAQLPHADTPPHSCAPAGADVRLAVLRPQTRSPVLTEAARETPTTRTPMVVGRETRVPRETPRASPGRHRLSALCRWRT